MKCIACEELSEERFPVEIESVKTRDGGYYNWGCEILHCPNCGKKIEYNNKQ